MSRKRMIFVNDDGTITRTWPPLHRSRSLMKIRDRYRVGGDIPADAINNRNSRDIDWDGINNIIQKIKETDKRILELKSKSLK